MRKTFASIAAKSHPSVNQNDFNFSIAQHPPNEEDIEIAEQIFDRLEELNDSYINSGTGEWEWLQQNRQSNYIDSLLNKDTKLLATILSNMFRNDSTYGYLSPSFDECKLNESKIRSAILCDVDTCNEFSNHFDFEILGTRKDIGNPFGLEINSSSFMLPDTPRHNYYASKIHNLLHKHFPNPTLLEIGGGFGGLCRQSMSVWKKQCSIINVDLLPALLVSYYYLKKNNINVTFDVPTNISDVKNGCVYLIPAEDFSNSKDYFNGVNLIFKSRSLCEMSEETCDMYINFINESNASYFYHENSNYLLFPNSVRHIENIADDFKINQEKFLLISKSITPFTGGEGRYREYLYSRI